MRAVFKKFTIGLLLLAYLLPAYAQPSGTVADSLTGKNYISPVLADSFKKFTITIPQPWQLNKQLPLQQQILAHHPYYNYNDKPQVFQTNIKTFNGKEWLFYSLLALFLLFGILKTVFPKYLADLFRVFFRNTLNSNQLSEQLVQNTLPSLLFNIFFTATTGMFITFLLRYNFKNDNSHFWTLYGLSCLSIGLIYFVKFVFLKFMGWLFNIKAVMNNYIFTVFISNKIIGIVILPLLAILAFSEGHLYQLALSAAIVFVFVVILYRYILGLGAIRNVLHISPFHFFLYLAAFEVVPVMMLYRAILMYF